MSVVDDSSSLDFQTAPCSTASKTDKVHLMAQCAKQRGSAETYQLNAVYADTAETGARAHNNNGRLSPVSE